MTSAAGAASDDLSRLITVLSRHGVDYVVCGGIACILHGVAGRVTADVDIAVRMDEANLRKLVLAARDLGLAPRVPEPLESLCDPRKRREWIEEKNAKVFTLLHPSSPLQLDVFLEYPVPYDELRIGSHEGTNKDCRFRYSSKEHLIQAKKSVRPPRKIDLRDIEDLTELLEHERTRK